MKNPLSCYNNKCIVLLLNIGRLEFIAERYLESIFQVFLEHKILMQVFQANTSQPPLE